MKKNTSLYLDRNLIEKAKRYRLNLSEISESAIRQRILAMGEKYLDFWIYLETLENERRVFFLPEKIKEVTLKETGPIKKIQFNFNEKNIIFGKNGSGKTTLIQAISYVFGHQFINSYIKENSTIKIKTFKRTNKEVYREKILSTNREKSNFKCLLIDSATGILDNKKLQKFLVFLKKIDIQVIMAEHERPDIDYKGFNKLEITSTK